MLFKIFIFPGVAQLLPEFRVVPVLSSMALQGDGRWVEMVQSRGPAPVLPSASLGEGSRSPIS